MSNFKVGDMVRPRYERVWPAFESGAKTARVVQVDVQVDGRVDGPLYRITEDSRLWHYDNLVAVIDEPEPAQLQPSGHMPDGSGIQRHSAGELYPYVLMYRDSKVPGRKYDIGIVGGKLLDTCWVPDSDTAISIIETLKGTS